MNDVRAWIQTAATVTAAVALVKIAKAVSDQSQQSDALISSVQSLSDEVRQIKSAIESAPRPRSQSPSIEAATVPPPSFDNNDATATIVSPTAILLPPAQAAHVEPSSPLAASTNTASTPPRTATDYLAEREGLRAAKLALLRKMPALTSARTATLEELAEKLRFEAFEAGTDIVRQGDYGEEMFFIASGSVAVTVSGRTVRTLREGDYFGDVALLFGSVRTATCTAATRTTSFVLHRDPFLAMLESEPGVRRDLERHHFEREEDARFTPDERLRPEVRAKVLAAVERRMAEYDARVRRAAGGSGVGPNGEALVVWQRRDLLGQGAFGIVYSAIDLSDGKLLAVKEISTGGRGASKSLLRQIRQESELMQRLSHPNIVRGYGIQLTDDAAYVLMELLPNGSLEMLMMDVGPLSESAARRYVEQLLRGLEYLHGKGVLHRDLKPSNFLLAEGSTVKLCDFGISKLTEGAKTAATASLAGTPAYMSADAIAGRSSIGSDLYALGCSVLQLVTGRLPWSEREFETTTQMLFHIATCGHGPTIPPCATPVPTCPDAAEGAPAARGDTGVDAGTLPPNHVTPELRSFLEITLNADPTQRGTCASLLKHPWITAVALPVLPAFEAPVVEEEPSAADFSRLTNTNGDEADGGGGGAPTVGSATFAAAHDRQNQTAVNYLDARGEGTLLQK